MPPDDFVVDLVAGVQAKEKADAGQRQRDTEGVNADIQAEWRMRAGSALDALRAQKHEQYDSLNIQVTWLCAYSRLIPALLGQPVWLILWLTPNTDRQCSSCGTRRVSHAPT